jgi:hypothetical protein
VKRNLRKVKKIGPLGTLNGIRMRRWFAHYGGADIQQGESVPGRQALSLPHRSVR